MGEKFYEVRDYDGMSATGASVLVGYYRDEQQAIRARDAVEVRDAWHMGAIHEHTFEEER